MDQSTEEAEMQPGPDLIVAAPASGDRGEHAYGEPPGSPGVSLVTLEETAVAGSSPGGSGDGDRQGIALIRAAIERALSYPALARKRRQEGTVIVEFSITAKGRPENLRVVKSSGFAILDRAATDTVVSASPFPVITGKIEVPITFRLKKKE